MAENDNPNIQMRDLPEALGLLTRLPVTSDGSRGIRAAWAWPVVGAIVAGLAGIVATMALWLQLPFAVAAGVALVTQIMLTGAMHEDGLADCADGFWGGANRTRRLEIMKDSAIGTYGTLALILSLLLRWSLLTALFDSGFIFAPLIAAAALSRLPMVAIMRYLPGARTHGLSASTGVPSQDTLFLATAAALLIAVILAGFAALPAAIATAAAAWVTAKVANDKIGGQTGDVLGASQQLAEITAFMALAVTLI